MSFKTNQMRLSGCPCVKNLCKTMTRSTGYFLSTLILCLSSFTLSVAASALSYVEPDSLFPGEGKFNQQRGIQKAYALKTVVIDAGHGGYDPGCLGSDSKEKEITLAIAKRLAQQIQARHPEIKVLLTRNDDTFVPLHERAALANKAQADLFISIHCNIMPPGPRAAGIYGTETYVMGLHTANHNLQVAKRENASILLENDYQQHYDYDPESPEGHIFFSMYQNAFLDQSIRLAEKIELQFGGNGRKSRGVKQAGFVVLKSTAMPSVLIETGFLSNASEQQFLLQTAGQNQIAQAILDAFSTYKSELDGNNATASPQWVQTTKRKAGTENPPAVLSYTAPETKTPKEIKLWYQVQLAASRNQLSPDYFMAVGSSYSIEVAREDNYFKYRVGNFYSLEEAELTRHALRSSGYPDAFVVPFHNGKKISLETARKLSQD